MEEWTERRAGKPSDFTIQDLAWLTAMVPPPSPIYLLTVATTLSLIISQVLW